MFKLRALSQVVVASVVTSFLLACGGGSGSGSGLKSDSVVIKQLITKHGLGESAAKDAFLNAFGYQPDTAVVPADATKEDSGASEDAKRAGVRVAAFGQLLSGLGLARGDMSALLAALAEDLADGIADGMSGAYRVHVEAAAGDQALPKDIANKFSTALYEFSKNTDKNKSGLNVGQVGLIKFNNKAVSESFTFELAPKNRMQVGKSAFTLTVTNNNDGSPATNIPVMMPVMYMAAGHMHGTPSKKCEATADAGVFECTPYFLMASTMANGDVMGNWVLKFSVGMGEISEAVHFFPNVMMDMSGDVGSVIFKGEGSDTYDMMGVPSVRPYFVFKDSLIGTAANHTLKLFVGTRYNMMSHPELTDTGTAEAGDLNSSAVKLFVGELESSVTTEATYKDGLWTVSNIDWLTDGNQGSIFVRLEVDAVFKKQNEGIVGELKLIPSAAPN